MTSTASAPTADATSTRIWNFSAGPAVLPEPVLRQCQHDLWDIAGSGIGILEHSHRGPVFNGVIEAAEANCRAVGTIGEEYEVLFLPGGATTQFALIPMCFLPSGQTADYVNTGVWATKAIKEARKFGTVNVAFDGTASDFDHVPADDELSCTSDAAYLHYCSNNTIYGTQFPAPPPAASDVPLIVDASSDIFSRPIDVDRHAMIYAGAQKNLGPAGMALVIIRKDLVEKTPSDLPMMFDYRLHAKKGSRLNTPPTFGIYVMGRVFEWILEQGGLAAMATKNAEKAAVVYDAIDHAGGFYRGVARPESRSAMNVTFRTPSADLDAAFLEEAATHDMSGLKGHRDAGGLRASIYNAFPKRGCQVLAEFMGDFARRKG
ncbi:MAG: 3-phosphoserine/phosphohydroxythreonine transaminase [Phycisphaerales bacterium]|nr:3-phosphoserine/phosphohydroxythreonine transaminase [Phycisphaerales bacterium]NNM25551.1 3-phosphoserine/phosphohydroxythreonine transaminase [Phycisphaerales bacterium]